MDVRVQVPPVVPYLRRADEFSGHGWAKDMVDVAQLVEHLIVVQEVVGSRPIVHPIFINSAHTCTIQVHTVLYY